MFIVMGIVEMVGEKTFTIKELSLICSCNDKSIALSSRHNEVTFNEMC